MELKRLPCDFTVCRVGALSEVDFGGGFCFVGQTDEELSVVCETARAPACPLARDDGWKAFRVQGTLDFSMTGVLSELSGVLAEERIGIFAVSTYNTDYILVKAENFARAMDALAAHGYDVT